MSAPLIAQQVLNHERCGLKRFCLDGEEEKLLQAFEALLSVGLESNGEIAAGQVNLS